MVTFSSPSSKISTDFWESAVVLCRRILSGCRVDSMFNNQAVIIQAVLFSFRTALLLIKPFLWYTCLAQFTFLPQSFFAFKFYNFEGRNVFCRECFHLIIKSEN